MNVWLDDIRPMPKGFDTHVQSAKEAIALINTKKVKVISLDHDLGDEKLYGTGYDVALHIEAGAFSAKIPRIQWQIHSQNPVGAKKMKQALDGADKFWDKIDNLYKEANSFRERNKRR